VATVTSHPFGGPHQNFDSASECLSDPTRIGERVRPVSSIVSLQDMN
jgi:hypothetical protein